MILMYFSLYLCRYGIGGKKTIFVALLELKSFFVMYGRHHLYINGCNYFVNNLVQWFFISFLDCMDDFFFMDVVGNEWMICLWM